MIANKLVPQMDVRKFWAMAAIISFAWIPQVSAQVVVSEFMAKNDSTLIDGDGNYSDWIELYNTSSNAVDLTGWYLSDDTNNLTQWVFPSKSIAAGEFLVVFASGQDAAGYADSLGYLHATFKLSGSGESVVLTQADGVTIAHSFLDYPEQDDDISYGLDQDSGSSYLIVEGEDATAFIGTSEPSASWNTASFDDSSWLSGTTAVGFDNYSPSTYTGIGLDVSDMLRSTASAYARVEFEVDSDADLSQLTLRMKYDDGFIAYINGVEVASANAPVTATYNSSANSSHAGTSYEDFTLLDADAYLTTDINVLAIHGVNSDSGSRDLYILPVLSGITVGSIDTNSALYLNSPTPGADNVAGVLGYVSDTSFSVDRGFFTNAFDVAINCKTDGSEIYYTIDGTTPTADNGTLYTAAVTIDQTTVLRAAAFVTGYQPSDVDTQTYLFLSDIITQSADASSLAPEWPSSSVNDQVFDYEMDPDVVTDPDYADQIEEALLDIPSISIVTDPDNLFDADSGIYVNAMSDGALWERETSVELINPDGTAGFQINGGVRIRGGSSRNSSNPKHSFRLFFRSEYGTSRLNYKLFGDEGADSFKRMDLRTGQNYSWQYGSRGGESTWLYDIFTRDVHREMGQPYTRSRFYHLYLNGQYWGLYQTEERPDARYGESYCGDDNDDYDVVKSGDSSGLIEATDGVLDDYQALWTAVNSGVSSDAAYFALQGMNADGTENKSYTRLLDVDNLIDYMLCVFYSGNRDSPIGPPGGGREPRNLFAFYNRTTPDGFKFVAHDGEHCLGYHLTDGVDYNHITDYSVMSSSTLTAKAYFNPWWLHLKLLDNDEYALRFADHVHRYLFNDGILTAKNAAALLTVRKVEMEMAIIAESARWGDYVTSTPRTKNDDWLPSVDDGILASYLQVSPNTRRDVVLSQIEDQGWYPTVDAPEFNQHGGSINSGFSLTLSGSGTIYYTTDGSDPRDVGGAVAGTAGSALTLTKSTQVKARVLSGSTWSALTKATFVMNEESPLRITEIMYNPTSGSDTNYSSADFEFIEILNTSDETVGLAGTEFSEGIQFDFTEGDESTLDPGEYAILVSNYEAFKIRYSNWADIKIAGQYYGKFFIATGALDNGGEDLTLVDGFGNTILDFEYNDSWYDITDGEGYSLTLLDPTAETNTWSESSSWRASVYTNGTPGYGAVADFPSPGDLVINEALTHQDDDTPGDWVELYNTSTNTIDINGWFLSDDEDDLARVELSGLSTIAAGGYLVLTEASHFGATAAGTNGFALSELGEGIYLSSGENGDLTGYREEEEFGAAERDVTFGRHVKSDGTTDFTAQSAQTSGATNLYPLIGDVVFTEVMYHPADSNGYEFVEICNPGSSSVSLYHPTYPTNTWKLAGAVDFTFPEGLTLAAGECLLVTETTEAAFRSYYTVDAGVTVLGPYDGVLNNDGEDLMLTRPGDPEVLTGEVPAILVELVEYNDVAPWPTAADGLGSSLGRVDAALYPNDSASWIANASPTPGAADVEVVDYDTDSDGMLDSWEVEHFGSIDAVNGGADEDWDNDDSSNVDEYIAGTIPTDSDSVFAFQTVETASDCVLTWSSATGKVYTLWICTNLVSGEFSITNSPISTTPPVNTFTTGVNNAECAFYRLTVEDE